MQQFNWLFSLPRDIDCDTHYLLWNVLQYSSSTHQTISAAIYFLPQDGILARSPFLKWYRQRYRSSACFKNNVSCCTTITILLQAIPLVNSFQPTSLLTAKNISKWFLFLIYSSGERLSLAQSHTFVTETFMSLVVPWAKVWILEHGIHWYASKFEPSWSSEGFLKERFIGSGNEWNASTNLLRVLENLSLSEYVKERYS